MSGPPTAQTRGGFAGHDNTKYIKKFSTNAGQSNGMNSKISF